MVLTETEAKTKWCHKCSAADGYESGRCIATGCLAWRWFNPEPETFSKFELCEDSDRMATKEPERPRWVPTDWIFCPPDDENYAGWREPEGGRAERHQGALARRRGYCGLAGKPEFAE